MNSAGLNRLTPKAFTLITLVLLWLLLSLPAGLTGDNKTEIKRLSAGELRDVVRENRGKVLILSFWSTLDETSKEEMAFLDKLYGGYKEKSLEIIGINVEGVEPDVIAPFVEMKGIKYPVFVGGDDVTEEYDIQYTPVTFILGKDGRVQMKEIGFDEGTKLKFRRSIDLLLAGS